MGLLGMIALVVNVISESLAQSLTDKHFAESFSNKNLAKAFSENQSYFLQQLNNTDIKERLAIASRRG